MVGTNISEELAALIFLKIEAVGSSKILVHTYQSTQCHMPEELNLNLFVTINTIYVQMYYILKVYNIFQSFSHYQVLYMHL
jgi:hypothetical protein